MFTLGVVANLKEREDIMSIKSYKGFNPDMTCRNFKYEEGKEYETETAEVCINGFHACEMPLEVFQYYPPIKSVYHEVEQDGDISKADDGSTKIASTKIKIGTSIGIKGLVKAQIGFVFEKSKNTTLGNDSTAASSKYKSTAASSGNWSTAATSGNDSTAATSGNDSTAASSGDYSIAATSGYCSIAASSGHYSTAASSVHCSTAASSGDYSTAVSSGHCSTAASAEYKSTAVSSGYKSIAASSGYKSSAVVSGTGSCAVTSGDESCAATFTPNGLAISCGKNCKVKGVIGSYIVLTEWNDTSDELIDAKIVRVDGKKIKADTLYSLKNGEFIECLE